MSDEAIRKRVGVVYTGGTIGMESDRTDPVPLLQFVELLGRVRGFRQVDARTIELTPHEAEQPVIEARFLDGWAGEPKDSALMEPETWLDLADCLRPYTTRPRNYSGFVVVHGTDTMAWTAAALSLLLGKMRRPVIVTGSQRPLGLARTDGVRNLVSALQFAAKADCPREVLLFFDDRLLRGNRATKVSVGEYAGFDSPNFPHLGRAGDELGISTLGNEVERTPAFKTVSPQRGSTPTVMTLRVQPGLNYNALLTHIPKPGSRAGLIVEAYGSGTAPQRGLEAYVTRWRALNAPVVVRSQVPHGSVQFTYGASKWLRDSKLGVIGGSDITNEALFVKMWLLLASGLSDAEVAEHLAISMAGEVTVLEATQRVARGVPLRSVPTESELHARIQAAFADHAAVVQTVLPAWDMGWDFLVNADGRQFLFQVKLEHVRVRVDDLSRLVAEAKSMPGKVQPVVISTAGLSDEASALAHERGVRYFTAEEYAASPEAIVESLIA